MPINILITAPYFQRDYGRLKEQLKDYEVDLANVKENLSKEELLQIIEKYNAVICGDDDFCAEVLDRAKNLKIIAKWGTGINSIDKEYAESKGIKVCNVPNAFTEPVSDSVISFILAFARNTIKLDKAMKAGKWEKLWGYTLGERTLGIIGMGNIGKRVAQKAQALGMKVIGNDIKPIDTDIEMVDLDTLLTKADFISLNCDLNKTSYHLLTLREMKKSGGIIINTSRGSVIKQDDLLKALEDEIIQGAAMDVYEEEPLPKEDLERLKKLNVILSPHNVNSSPLYYEKVHQLCIKNINEILNKRP